MVRRRWPESQHTVQRLAATPKDPKASLAPYKLAVLSRRRWVGSLDQGDLFSDIQKYVRDGNTNSRGAEHCNGSCPSQILWQAVWWKTRLRPCKHNTQLGQRSARTDRSVRIRATSGYFWTIGRLSLPLVYTGIWFESNEIKHIRSIDDPAPMADRMRFLLEELAACIFAPKESATAVKAPGVDEIIVSVMDTRNIGKGDRGRVSGCES